MASEKNDALRARTVEGSVNFYQNHKCKGTAADRGLAERLSGCEYNIISNSDQHEVYLRDLRRSDHIVDGKGRHTAHFFGARRRKFSGDERGMISETMRHPEPHPRENVRAQRRLETQLAQLENHSSYAGFQQRTQGTFSQAPPVKKYHVHNARYANEVEKLQPSITSKGAWLERRGEIVTHSKSAPSLSIADPASSLSRAVREDIRKDVSQRQLESAHVAPRMTANTLSASMDAVPLGQHIANKQRSCSVNRVENHDFGITRKNNHFSSQDKLTRADPFYMRPREGITNNSVKYDIVSNERRWFKY
mmetsp:Transcript_127396/g.318030  ORF Transcript_127396/g.318030 Transcript_127396/m.318030 type:complete len:307 (+) Transcript_127396:104-1024(+)